MLSCKASSGDAGQQQQNKGSPASLQPQPQLTQQQAAVAQLEDPPVDPAQLQLEKQRLRQATADKGFALKYIVPWDIWFFIQVTAAVWVVNQSIPYAVLSSAAHMQGVQQLSDLPLVEKEVLGLLCQFVQLGCTYLIITTATSKYQPLEHPWFSIEAASTPIIQAFATAIAAVGSGVLLAGVLTGNVDGAEEWRHLAGLHADKTGVAALVLGAVVLAPLTEEFYFRGFVLPSLTKWMNPLLAVPLTGLLFASAHPADAFPAEALLGSILSLSLLAADGNLLVPLLGHALYNSCVLGAEFLL